VGGGFEVGAGEALEDPHLGHLAAREERPELGGRIEDRARPAEELPADEDGVVGERHDDVALGEAGELLEDGERLVERLADGVVLGGVNEANLDEAIERQDDLGAALADDLDGGVAGGRGDAAAEERVPFVPRGFGEVAEGHRLLVGGGTVDGGLTAG
jgi:hypothetical protein